MKIYPAIDIKDGCCVQLVQGKFDHATVFGNDPVATAKRWESQGAEYIHIVDLDGARYGTAHINDILRRIIAEVSIPIQVGGGIRTLEDIREKLEIGVSRVILGTAAVTDPETTRRAAELYGSRIAVGIDASNGKAAITGWTDFSEKDSIEMIRELYELGIRTVIYTDIEKDGMMSGPNDSVYKDLTALFPGMDIIASGGITTPEDLRSVAEAGVDGAIIGTALYKGTIDLQEAIRLGNSVARLKTQDSYIAEQISVLVFDERGLIPVIAQDMETNEVLMLAYANREALELTMQTNKAHYFSRSRNKIWLKGETSGNLQMVDKILYDCDCDAVIYLVYQKGVAACHTGNRSCFYRSIKKMDVSHEVQNISDDDQAQSGETNSGDSLAKNPLVALQQRIANRRLNPREGSYTQYLFKEGINKILKKIGEESAETIIAAKDNKKSEVAYETADLLYHLSVLLEVLDMDWINVFDELESRIK